MTTQKPIFIFSAVPGSGLGRIQKLISSTQEIMIWTTPLGVLPHLIETIRLLDFDLTLDLNNAFSGEVKKQKKIITAKDDLISHVGNMRCSTRHMKNAFRELFLSMYDLPSKKLGFTNWGLSGVGIDKTTINSLKFIFSEAKFIFLIRHPLECLIQFRASKARFRNHYGQSLNENDFLDYFFEAWAQAADNFNKNDQVFIIKYEDFLAGTLDMKLLSRYLGTELDLKAPKMNKRGFDAEVHDIALNDFNKNKAAIDLQLKKWNYS